MNTPRSLRRLGPVLAALAACAGLGGCGCTLNRWLDAGQWARSTERIDDSPQYVPRTDRGVSAVDAWCASR